MKQVGNTKDVELILQPVCLPFVLFQNRVICALRGGGGGSI